MALQILWRRGRGEARKSLLAESDSGLCQIGVEKKLKEKKLMSKLLPRRLDRSRSQSRSCPPRSRSRSRHHGTWAPSLLTFPNGRGLEVVRGPLTSTSARRLLQKICLGAGSKHLTELVLPFIHAFMHEASACARRHRPRKLRGMLEILFEMALIVRWPY